MKIKRRHQSKKTEFDEWVEKIKQKSKENLISYNDEEINNIKKRLQDAHAMLIEAQEFQQEILEAHTASFNESLELRLELERNIRTSFLHVLSLKENYKELKLLYEEALENKR